MAVSTIKAEFQCEIEKVWELVTSLDNYSWRSDLDKIVVTVPEKSLRNARRMVMLQSLIKRS